MRACSETATRRSIRPSEEAPERLGEPAPGRVSGCVERRDRRPVPEGERGRAEHRRERLVHVDEVEALAGERTAHLRHRVRAQHEVRERAVAGDDHRAAERDHAGRRWARPALPRVEDAAERAGRVVADQQAGLDPGRLERATLRVGVVDDAAAERPRIRDDDADLHPGRGYRRRASSKPTTAPASRSCPSTEIPTPWRPPPRWKTFSPRTRSHGTMCSRSGIDAAAPPSTAGSSRPRRAASSRERDEAAADLEAAVGDVLVRHAIAGDVQRRAKQQRERPRADDGSQRRARRDVQRDDHAPIIAYGPRHGPHRLVQAPLLAASSRRWRRGSGDVRGEYGEGGYPVSRVSRTPRSERTPSRPTSRRRSSSLAAPALAFPSVCREVWSASTHDARSRHPRLPRLDRAHARRLGGVRAAARPHRASRLGLPGGAARAAHGARGRRARARLRDHRARPAPARGRGRGRRRLERLQSRGDARPQRDRRRARPRTARGARARGVRRALAARVCHRGRCRRDSGATGVVLVASSRCRTSSSSSRDLAIGPGPAPRSRFLAESFGEQHRRAQPLDSRREAARLVAPARRALCLIVAGSIGAVRSATDLATAWSVPEGSSASSSSRSSRACRTRGRASASASSDRGSALMSETLNSNSINLVAGLAVPAALGSLGCLLRPRRSSTSPGCSG